MLYIRYSETSWKHSMV